MKLVSIIQLALAALTFSMTRAGDARADFLVICPTGGLTVDWFGSGEGRVDQVSFPTVKSVGFDPTTVLVCKVDAPARLQASFPLDGACSGGAEYRGTSAVFGRNELFRSVETPAISAEVDGDECILGVPFGGQLMTLELTEPCESNNDDISWTCPDDAFPVFRP
jgi:hypothetical protein